MNRIGCLGAATLVSFMSMQTPAADAVAFKDYAIARDALEGAKAVARAGHGHVLAVGGLMTETAAPSNSVVILSQVAAADIKPGMVLIMAKLECGERVCLIARRVTSTEGEIETEPYPSIEGLLFREVRATVLGAVRYSVDLDNAVIRDLRPGHDAILSFDRAIAQERGMPARDRDGGLPRGHGVPTIK